MAWTPDFCLSCDRQTAGAAYCSQACRLADLESAVPGHDVLLPTLLSAPYMGPNPSSPSTTATGFFLPPPVDFAAYRQRLPTSSSSSSSSPSLPDVTGGQLQHPLQPQGQMSASAAPRCAATWHDGYSCVQLSSPSASAHDPLRARLTPSSSQTSLVSMQSTSSLDDGRLPSNVRTELRAYARCFDRLRDLKQHFTRR